MEQFNLIYETKFLILWLAVPHFMTSILINIKKKKKKLIRGIPQSVVICLE